eukprot:m.200263 g.200263  ORF g.200263 m.200263 type:complete len:657 (+) comp17051_c0_seq1:581-2551(+)
MRCPPNLAVFWLVALQCHCCARMVYPADVFAKGNEPGFIDVTKAPFNADNTGQNDAADAIIAAYNTLWDPTTIEPYKDIDDNGQAQGKGPHRTLYFPAGRYRITKEIVYTINRTWDHGPAGDALDDCIHFQGEGYQTVLFMPDSLPACRNESHPQAVVAFIADGGLSNVAMKNSFQDMTIELGADNPACDGLAFHGNNGGVVRRVCIVGRSGRIGLRLTDGLTGLSLLRDIYVYGFSIGIASNSTHPGNVLEHVKLVDQTQYGIAVWDNQLAVRDLVFNSTLAEAAVYVGDTGDGMLTLVDTVIHGEGQCALDVADGFLFARNLTQDGFAVTVCHSEFEGKDSVLNEFSTTPGIVLGDGCGNTTLQLPVEETPELYNPPLSEWVSVEAFGAYGGDDQDDTAAIQAAINSGASLVYLPPTRGIYQLSDSINITGSLQRLDLFWSLLNSTRLAARQPIFNLGPGQSSPVWVHHVNPINPPGYLFRIQANRTFVLSEMQSGAHFVTNDPAASDFTLFVEAVACGATCHNVFGGRTYARCYDAEGSNIKFNQTGGLLWILGFKTENNGTDIRVRNNAQVELLGGEWNRFGDPWSITNPAFDIQDCRASFVGAEFGPNKVPLEALYQSQGRKLQLLGNDTRIPRRNIMGNGVFAPVVFCAD